MRAAALVEAVAGGGPGARRALSQTLSLCESRLEAQREIGEEAARALGLRGQPAHRIGVTGPPGAGKSTLIEALGNELLASGRGRVAVLCVDPSSALTGGSVLGDRTRMARLSVAEECFVRACASGGDEGGLNSAARHQLLALEGWASGGHVLVETVGVGQSEHEVEGVVDTMLLVLAPGAGDQLQGMKRGITELADIVVVSKADGELEAAAARAASDYRASLRLLGARKTEGWTPPVLRCSAESGKGLAGLAAELERHRQALGDVRARRRAKEWAQLWMVCSRMHTALLQHSPQVQRELPSLRAAVESGAMTVDTAARRILQMD